MKVSIDRDANLLYINWGGDGAIGREVAPGVILLSNPEGKPVALEVINLSQRTSDSLNKLLFSYAPLGSSGQDPPAGQEIAIEFPSKAAVCGPDTYPNMPRSEQIS